MAKNKNYAALDNIGFVGTSRQRSASQVARDVRHTSDYIKRYKAGAQNSTVVVPIKVKRANVAGRFTKTANTVSLKHTTQVK